MVNGDRLIESAGNFIQTMLNAWTEVMRGTLDQGGAPRQGPPGWGPPMVELVAGPGTIATAHFAYTSESGAGSGLAFFATDATSSSRVRLDAATITLLPDAIDSLSTGGTCRVRVVAAVPESTPPGRYSGLVLCDGDPTWGAILHVDVILSSVPAEGEQALHQPVQAATGRTNGNGDAHGN
jgi:hypothetical protein